MFCTHFANLVFAGLFFRLFLTPNFIGKFVQRGAIGRYTLSNSKQPHPKPHHFFCHVKFLSQSRASHKQS